MDNNEILIFLENQFINLLNSECKTVKELFSLLIKTSSNIGVEKNFTTLLSKSLLNNKNLKFIEKVENISKGYKQIPDLIFTVNDMFYFIEIKLASSLRNLFLGYQSDKNTLAKKIAEKLNNHKELKNFLKINGKVDYVSQSIIYDCFKHHTTDKFSTMNEFSDSKNKFKNKVTIAIGIVATFDERQINIFHKLFEKDVLFSFMSELSKDFECNIEKNSIKSQLIQFKFQIIDENEKNCLLDDIKLICILIIMMIKKNTGTFPQK